MEEEFIGHVLTCSRTSDDLSWRYSFVACQCSTVNGCVLARKVKPSVRELKCAYQALYENPLVRVRMIVKTDTDEIARFLEVLVPKGKITFTDVRAVLTAVALADERYMRFVENEMKILCSAIQRMTERETQFNPTKLTEAARTNPLFELMVRINRGFRPHCNAQDTVNAGILFGVESAGKVAVERLKQLILDSCENFVKSSVRYFGPILRPDMVADLFGISPENKQLAFAAAMVRAETEHTLAVPHLRLEMLGVSVPTLNALINTELVGENGQGVYRSIDLGLIEAMGRVTDCDEECPVENKTADAVCIRMKRTEEKSNAVWRTHPISAHLYTVTGAKVFFDGSELVIEWIGHVAEKNGYTPAQIFDMLFYSQEHFGSLEEVHIHATGITERIVAAEAKRAFDKWKAREVFVWEAKRCRALVSSDPFGFEICCGKPEIGALNTVACCAHPQPNPIALGKETRARAFVNFFADESWCIASTGELGRVVKKRDQVFIETAWNKNRTASKRREIKTHQDALPLLSVPFLRTYTLPDGFFRGKHAAWIDSAPISSFILREHQRLFHGDADI